VQGWPQELQHQLFDIVIVGGGIVGLASARTLILKHLGLSTVSSTVRPVHIH
jgi:glycerol-3-phosphate dehydrogenase